MSQENPSTAVDGDDLTDKQISVNDLESVHPLTEGPIGDRRSHRYECRICGYVYDPSEGVRKFGINKGTPFDDLDSETFRCPVCRAKTDAFRDIGPKEKPSGFEENLNYGFGANSLTAGQKNILIFGGLALVVSFFLSLYSLR